MNFVNVKTLHKIRNNIGIFFRILGDDNEVKNIIADQLKKIAKKYGQERKTTLISGEEITEYNETENIDDYPLTIFVTRDNYIKKISAVSLRSSTTEHKLKETDEIVQTMESTNKSELIFFKSKYSRQVLAHSAYLCICKVICFHFICNALI